MNNLLVALILGFLSAIVLTVTRSREDADKKASSYIVKVMIVVCPIIFLGLTYITTNTKQSGGSLEMRTGNPDF